MKNNSISGFLSSRLNKGLRSSVGFIFNNEPHNFYIEKSLGPAAAIVVGALAVSEGIALGVTLHCLLLAYVFSHRKFPEQRLHMA